MAAGEAEGVPRGVVEWARRLLEGVDVLSEPGAAQLLALAGEKPPRVPARLLCGADGTCLETGAENPCCEEAWLPLAPLQRSIESRMHLIAGMLAETLRALSKSLGAPPPLFADYNDYRRMLRCRPRLGCSRIPAGQAPRPLTGGELPPPGLMPRLCVPTLLSVRCTRVGKRTEVESHVVKLSTPSRCTALLCPDGCHVTVDPGSIKLGAADGGALLLAGTRCLASRLAADLLYTKAYAELGEADASRPALWTMPPLLPLHAEGDPDRLTLVLWNPSPKAMLHEIRASRHRIRAARVYSISSRSWEELRPELDRLLLPSRPYGIMLVQLEMRRLPPLLQGARRTGKP